MSETPTHPPAPLRSALKMDDEAVRTPPASGSLKAVQIADPVPEDYIEDDSYHAKRRSLPNAPARRVSGRLSATASPAIRPVEDSALSSHHHHSHSNRRNHQSERILAQVGEWLERERKKAMARKLKPRRRKSKSPPSDQVQTADTAAASASSQPSRERSNSTSSQSSDISFDGLQHILEVSMASMGLTSLPKYSPRVGPKHRRPASRSSLHRAASSDTDYVDGDAIVPSCDAWLDNSKTMSYTGGASASTEDASAQATKVEKEKEAWTAFKNEILRIAHTLRLKGWRRIPLGSGEAMSVERLSGALTNAVYVVTPPSDLPQLEGRKPPTKVLLRVYGPQVEHLIDRENELQVLQRLARKKIGPRLLGTFKNGRFEQFFNAITLTPLNLREPETSKQIAKRMRELHDGIEVLLHERENGPGVWKNWDQWLDNVGRITSFLDKELEKTPEAERRNSVAHAWKANGYVCGVPWEQFKDVVIKYRTYLNNCYKNKRSIRDRLVFAHNDTQYGNILRIRPDDEKSPLLQPANKHKQLVVIDFEYAAPNTTGLEFANHFTEWMYNYHDPVAPFACHADRYPNLEEQKRFIRAYVDHRPQFPQASSTPRLTPLDSGVPSAAATPSLLPTTSSSSIVDFMLDARYPGGDWGAVEKAREEQIDQQVRELIDEARLWQPANSAQWIAWGIVQAKVPGLDGNPEEEEPGADEFDYLSYAQDRAMFFWGDCVQLGLVKLEELPEALRARVKLVKY
ncbi:choline kinase [Trichoderma arundinaceum]|uniref:Choline kinase n=1 Tax=Trichoderma arundinaceum TaxID=490622 RepID=A0A395N975_TRIAR|nr:choline kinase [Trichoderma arundinaceum]